MNKIFPNYDKIILFDVETTGFHPESNQIIEFAGVKYSKGIFDEINILIRAKVLPKKIVELTGITQEILSECGISELDAAIKVCNWICKDPGSTLLIAHNAPFDIKFLLMLFRKFGYPIPDMDILDTLTVFRDRKEYPNKLEDAIEFYGLEGVKNSHRAICDVWALDGITREMHAERHDLDKYINLIGMYPNHPVPEEEKIKKLTYTIQPYKRYGSAPLYLRNPANTGK